MSEKECTHEGKCLLPPDSSLPRYACPKCARCDCPKCIQRNYNRMMHDLKNTYNLRDPFYPYKEGGGRDQ